MLGDDAGDLACGRRESAACEARVDVGDRIDAVAVHGHWGSTPPPAWRWCSSSTSMSLALSSSSVRSAAGRGAVWMEVLDGELFEAEYPAGVGHDAPGAVEESGRRRPDPRCGHRRSWRCLLAAPCPRSRPGSVPARSRGSDASAHAVRVVVRRSLGRSACWRTEGNPAAFALTLRAPEDDPHRSQGVSPAGGVSAAVSIGSRRRCPSRSARLAASTSGWRRRRHPLRRPTPPGGTARRAGIRAAAP